MNTELIEKLIKEQNYCVDNINIDYDIMDCEYRIEVILCTGNMERIMERIAFTKDYSDSSDSLFTFGSDLKTIGEIFQSLSKIEEDN